ncbi:unnamed protein product [Cylindrotheca closterium]|uniref:PPM-type phosphatase domain-containing protein n=1 Tax=Cylindrotheca closterium TaxID=2856 RepID=A0AAD2CY19_9STRA|nr:unnamed protein product [Cylindrotheca closterium]
MPWFKRLFGIVGGCTRSTLHSNSNRGVASPSIRCIPSTIMAAHPSRVPPPIRLLDASTAWQCRTLSTTATTATNSLPTTLQRRSFWTTGGEGDDNDHQGTESSPPRTITLTYRQSFLNNPAATYPVCVCTAQGLRSYMEDEHFYSQDGEFAAVFDGHGGDAVSRYLRKNLYANVQAFLPSLTADDNSNAESSSSTKRPFATLEDYQHAITSAIEKVDREVQRISHWSFQGSTAVAVWVHEDRAKAKKTIVTANVGDSRAVLSRNGTAYDLSKDHKPDDPKEEARIEALGGKVVWCGDVDSDGNPIPEEGIYRVNGNLALSRAVGDRSERPHVVANPDITFQPILEGHDNFIIVATDGLWDVFDSDDAVDFVMSMRQSGHDLERIATLVVEEALRRGTYDNVTVVIIWLDEKVEASKPGVVEQEI